MLPEKSETERSAELQTQRWAHPNKQEAKVVASIDEITAFYNEGEAFFSHKIADRSEEHGDTRVGPRGFKTISYSPTGQASVRVGYQCGACEQLIVGPPLYEASDSLGATHAVPVPSVDVIPSVDVYCRECDAHLEHQPNLMS